MTTPIECFCEKVKLKGPMQILKPFISKLFGIPISLYEFIRQGVEKTTI